MEATPGIEPGFTDLQSAASPLRHVASTKLPKNTRQAAGGYNRKPTRTTTVRNEAEGEKKATLWGKPRAAYKPGKI
jgi:hypothetical protein